MTLRPILITTLTFFYVSSSAQDLTHQADSIRLKYSVPELAFAVVTADKILSEQYLGYHKAGDHLRSDTAKRSDYFHLGSNTKAITGFIAAYLVGQHQIEWKTKFFDLFPSLKSRSNKAYLNITLQDLLSHRARIEPYTSGLEFAELPEFTGTKQEQRQQFSIYVLKEKPVSAAPGVVFNYSNAGYSVASAMLEKVSGLSWEQLVEKVINKTLDLNVKFGWPNKIGTDQPWGHWKEGGKLVPVPGDTDYNLDLAEPAGDISITLPDYIKFVQLNLQGLSGKGNYLQPDTYKFLHYGAEQYAIGWGNDLKDGAKISQHDGSAGTFYCRTVIDAKMGTVYIIMVNDGSANGSKAVNALSVLFKKTSVK